MWFQRLPEGMQIILTYADGSFLEVFATTTDKIREVYALHMITKVSHETVQMTKMLRPLTAPVNALLARGWANTLSMLISRNGRLGNGALWFTSNSGVSSYHHRSADRTTKCTSISKSDVSHDTKN